MSKKEKSMDTCNDLKMIYKTSSGEEVYRSDNSIVVMLQDHRNTLTTSYVNGGYRENLQAVFNHQPKPTEGCRSEDMEGGSNVTVKELSVSGLPIHGTRHGQMAAG